MDSIKYQVFISSTYSDLVEERKQILEVLLMADCIPAGMENFVATDEEQFNVIKKVIDLCDYYILILGRRYGSLNNTGISYTEMEYNYAIENRIPVLVFALDETVEVDEDKTERDVIKRGKLAEFRNKAMRNRLASVWKDKTDLMSKVAISIMRAKIEIERPGWHRGNDEEKERLLSELEVLRKENEELRNAQETAVDNNLELNGNFYGKPIILHYTEKIYIMTLGTKIDKKVVPTTLDQLYKFISLRITGNKKLTDFKEAINKFVEGYIVDEQEALIVRNRYEQLGLIESYTVFGNGEMVRMTDLGIKIMNELNR